MANVLIVDDSPTARMLVRRCLQIAGYGADQMFEAEHGRAALDVLRVQSIDLAVVDLNMPVMDGRTLIRFMRSSPRHNSIPIIVVSSLVNDTAAAELVAMGASTVLKKPLSPAAMASAIAELQGVAA
jgi:two-component system chemotaxis response regulator CheY